MELIGLDGTLYDQVLDTIFYLGLAPPRFQVLFATRLSTIQPLFPVA